jgi:hypothetical protein
MWREKLQTGVGIFSTRPLRFCQIEALDFSVLQTVKRFGYDAFASTHDRISSFVLWT